MMYQQQGYRPPDPTGANQAKHPTGRDPHTSRNRRTGFPFKAVFIVLLVLVLIAGAVYLFNWYSAYSATRDYDGVFLDNIYINGIPMGGLTLQEGYDAIVANVTETQNSWSLDLTYSGHVYYTLNYGIMGIQTDMDQLLDITRKAYAIGHTGDAFQKKRDLDSLADKPYSDHTIQSSMTTVYLDQILSEIARDMHREPQDAFLASFNPDAADPFVITPESYGRQLDTASCRETILSMLSEGVSGSLELVPESLAPQVTVADVRSRLTLIATGTTPISPSSTANRNDNIRVAFSRFNGLVVEKDQRVSFNDTVGERTKANGFLEADEYVYGDLVVGIGGGVCQASTTLYKAVLLANLKVNKREPHSETVSYTTFGQDATVYWGGKKIDFVFTNTSGAPIYITAHVEQNGKSLQCVVNIYGRSLGNAVYYTLETQTVEEIPKPEVAEYIKDTKQLYVTYTGEEYLVRPGRDGFVNETYLQRWENGELTAITLVSRDTYEALADRYYIGVKDPIG